MGQESTQMVSTEFPVWEWAKEVGTTSNLRDSDIKSRACINNEDLVLTVASLGPWDTR